MPWQSTIAMRPSRSRAFPRASRAAMRARVGCGLSAGAFAGALSLIVPPLVGPVPVSIVSGHAAGDPQDQLLVVAVGQAVDGRLALLQGGRQARLGIAGSL